MRTVRYEGLRGLFKGLVPPLVGNAPARRASAGSFMTLALIAGLTGGALLGVVLFRLLALGHLHK